MVRAEGPRIYTLDPHRIHTSPLPRSLLGSSPHIDSSNTHGRAMRGTPSANDPHPTSTHTVRRDHYAHRQARQTHTDECPARYGCAQRAASKNTPARRRDTTRPSPRFPARTRCVHPRSPTASHAHNSAKLRGGGGGMTVILSVQRARWQDLHPRRAVRRMQSAAREAKPKPGSSTLHVEMQ